MEKRECSFCYGRCVIQPSENRGYSGVCQTCQGEGYEYKNGRHTVTKQSYESYMQDLDEDWISYQYFKPNNILNNYWRGIDNQFLIFFVDSIPAYPTNI